MAEYEAVRLLGLRLKEGRQAGFDAIEERDGKEHRFSDQRGWSLARLQPGQRMGSIDVAKEFDGVLLVLLDENFDAMEIYEADRSAVLAALAAPGSKARNERCALPLTKFKAIGRLRW